MTVQEAKKAIIEVIVESTEAEFDVTESTNLFSDMGLASVEVVVMLNDLEEAFGVEIPVSKLRSVRTVGDLTEIVISILKHQV